MIVDSLRFGLVEVPDNKIINMVRPILGFEEYKNFCLIEMDDLHPFLWLQSTDNPTTAFLVLNPLVFFPNYRININSNEIAELNVNDSASVETYVVVTIPEKPEEISANLQGPILINTENNKAKQLVLVNSEYNVKHHIIDAMNQLMAEEEQEKELVEL